MSSRTRSSKEKKMNASHSQPSALRITKQTPLILPQIKSRRPTFYDEITVSPDFVDISSTTRENHAKPPQSQNSALYSSRMHAFLPYSENQNYARQKFAEEDRIVQRYEQQQQQYHLLMENIKKKSLSRKKKQEKGSLSLIYERLMGMM